MSRQTRRLAGASINPSTSASNTEITDAPQPSTEHSIQELRSLVEAQAAELAAIRQAAQPSSTNNSSAAPKAPTPCVYAGTIPERTSMSIRSFFYRIEHTANFSNLDPQRTLELALCHLTDRASTWYMRVEREGTVIQDLNDLRSAMFKEFVPQTEKTQAKVDLVALRFRASDDPNAHIDRFEQLMEVSQTRSQEAYQYFFMTLPDPFKADLTKFFEGDEPTDIHAAYRRVRTLCMAEKYGNPQHKPNNDRQKFKRKFNKDEGKGSSKRRFLDKQQEDWGPARGESEKRFYRRNDRCFKCGKESWSDPKHPCRQHQKSERSKGQSKN